MPDQRSGTALLHRALDTLVGARVVEATLGADGSLYLDLEHRGTDDEACTVNVEPDAIHFKDES